ncbi:MAG: uroporphyrinogen decarboxylase family protein [Bacillota bacterium]
MMTSFERTISALSHKEGDRVPLFLLLSIYGAKEMQVSIKEYFSRPELILEAQIRMKKKYNNDCFYSFSYAPIEIEAWGGEVIFVEDGPPNSGENFIKSIDQISTMKVPDVRGDKNLARVLETTQMLKAEAGDETPIIGVVMSPFSLPVIQMGFEKYLELLYFHEAEFQKLMRINTEFCVEWANAQIEAGATAICYFDPLASPNIIEKEKYMATGNLVARETIGRIKGPTATHLASGIAFPVINEVTSTGTAVLGFSANDDLKEIKAAAKDRICLLGNLNALEMVHWSASQVESHVKNVIAEAGIGGGLILAENHGEIPWQVSEDTLIQISEAVRKWGNYPLDWVENG